MPNTVYTRLTSRQIRKHFGENQIPESVSGFIQDVNHSYTQYEEDINIIKRSLDLYSKELSDKNRQLNETIETLEDFNYGVSHDLKTYTINIISLVSMLKKYQVPGQNPKTDEIIALLDKTSQNQFATLKNFLTLSTMNTILKTPYSVFNILDCLTQLLKNLEDYLRKNKVKINVFIAPDQTLFFSSTQFESILQNLITNSVKYKKPNESPIVNIRTINDTEHTIIEFSDNSVGIDIEKNKHKLFKPFKRFTDTKTEGTGVGLFIIKRYVERQGGVIELKSKPNNGLTIALKFKKIA